MVEVVEYSLSELERAVWELDQGVLVDKAVVQAAECLVLLVDSPRLPIELDLDDILGVGAMIGLILDHPRARDLHVERNLEEKAALAGTIFRARLHVIDECLGWEEDVAEFTLHRDRVLEDPLVDLDSCNFLGQLPVAILDI